MSTSGSSDFNVTRDQIISAAARKVGAIRAGETIGSQAQTDFAQALNAMVKRWQASGIHVWTVTEATLFPQASTSQYAISNASTSAHATQSYVEMELDGAHSSGATSITVDSTTGVSSGDYIGTVLSSGSISWDVVSGSPTSTTIALTTGLSGAASDGAAVFAYTSKIVRPLRIVDARRYNISGATDTPIQIAARLDYQSLPNKSQTGTINQLFYDPQLTTGQLYLWNPPSSVTDLVKFTWWRPIMDFDSAGDNPDLPQEWIDTLIFNLAVSMAWEYPMSADKYAGLKGQADEFLAQVAGADREPESVHFGVDMRW